MHHQLKRLSHPYKCEHGVSKGTIACEILVFERGSWVSLPIYGSSCQTTQDGKHKMSGYVESTSDRRFRVILTYTDGHGRRPAHWAIEDDLLCAMYVDGRRKPICEHSKSAPVNKRYYFIQSLPDAPFQQLYAKKHTKIQ